MVGLGQQGWVTLGGEESHRGTAEPWSPSPCQHGELLSQAASAVSGCSEQEQSPAKHQEAESVW